jgi:hypothetical protein
VCIVSAGESQLPSPKSKKMPTITLIMPDDPRGRHSAEMLRRASNSAKQQRGVI